MPPGLADDRRYRLHDGLLVEDVGTGTIVVDPASGMIYRLNGTAAAIVALIQDDRTAGEIVSVLGERYDARPDVLGQEVSRLIADLEEEGLIDRI